MRAPTLLLCLLVAACGRNGGTFPAAVTSPSPATATTGSYMRGTVSDTAFHQLADATIEIVSGPSAGLTTRSDSAGQWGFAGLFDDSSQFRATKDGYESAIERLGAFCAACNPNRWVNFVLAPHVTPANIEGSYEMTIVADRCTNLPEALRTRTYAVTLPATANAYFSMSPTGANFVPGWNMVEGGVAGNYVGLWFETLVEEVAPGSYLMIGASAGGNVDPGHPGTITMRADGRISYCKVDAASGPFEVCLRGGTTKCDSQQHTIILTRR
jgi:hypothetical protein